MGSIATNCWTDSGLWALIVSNHLVGDLSELLQGVLSGI